MSAIYNMQKQHGQFSSFQDLMFDLKVLRFSESLMLQYFWTKKGHCFSSIKNKFYISYFKCYFQNCKSHLF